MTPRTAITALATIALLAGCGSGGGSELQRLALEPLGERGKRFEAESTLHGADREAYFWLLWRAARRHTVNASQADTVDANETSPEFLARQVVRARAAQRWPWSPRDEDKWRRGILMYRVGTETLTDWSAYFGADAAVAARVAKFGEAASADPEGALRGVIHYLNAEVLGAKAKKKNRGLPDLDPATCLREGGGRSTDLAIAAVCLLRTWGVPAILVRAPLVSGDPGGDVWVEILGKGWWIRPADEGPAGDSYFRFRQDSRALFKVYACSELNEYSFLVEARNAIPFRTSYNFILNPAADITASTACHAPVRMADLPVPCFLSGWAGGGWLEVVPGKPQEDGTTEFGECGAGDLLYLPTVPGSRGIFYAVADPFVLHADGSREAFRAGDSVREWEWIPAEGEATARPCIWRKGQFQPCAIAERDGKQIVQGAPGALYLLMIPPRETGAQGKPVGRPFKVAEDGSIVRY